MYIFCGEEQTYGRILNRFSCGLLQELQNSQGFRVIISLSFISDTVYQKQAILSEFFEVPGQKLKKVSR